MRRSASLVFSVDTGMNPRGYPSSAPTNVNSRLERGFLVFQTEFMKHVQSVRRIDIQREQPPTAGYTRCAVIWKGPHIRTRSLKRCARGMRSRP